jgi:hypothetical protein
MRALALFGRNAYASRFADARSAAPMIQGATLSAARPHLLQVHARSVPFVPFVDLPPTAT